MARLPLFWAAYRHMATDGPPVATSGTLYPGVATTGERPLSASDALGRSSFLCARKGVVKTTKQGHSDRDGSRKLLLLGIQQHDILCLLDRYGHLWRDAEKAISRVLCDRVGNEAVDDALEIQLVEVLELGFRRMLILIQPHRLR